MTVSSLRYGISSDKRTREHEYEIGSQSVRFLIIIIAFLIRTILSIEARCMNETREQHRFQSMIRLFHSERRECFLA